LVVDLDVGMQLVVFAEPFGIDGYGKVAPPPLIEIFATATVARNIAIVTAKTIWSQRIFFILMSFILLS